MCDTNVCVRVVTNVQLPGDVTPVTIALSEREVRIIECNGNLAELNEHTLYSLPPEYLSSFVVLGELLGGQPLIIYDIFEHMHSISTNQPKIYRIEIVINVFSAALTTKDGCSSKIVCTKYVHTIHNSHSAQLTTTIHQWRRLLKIHSSSWPSHYV